MRVYVLCSLLAVTVARPQMNITPDQAQPIIENPQHVQNLSVANEETRTYQTNHAAIRDSVKHVANQLADMNTTVDFTMDTRTPPKVKLQHRNMVRRKQEAIENSHPGIAVPIDVDTFLETSTQKRPPIYRVENTNKPPPTTDSGISTWILLSGQSTTSKPARKQATVRTPAPVAANKGTTTTDKPVKPTIKIKPITTRKPKTTTTAAPMTSKVVETNASEKTQQINNKILTKIKASVLSNAVKNKTSPTTTVAPQTTISVVTMTTVKKTVESENTESNDLQPEPKDGGIELDDEKQKTTTKRPRRPANNNNNKKKKNNNNNKNRRRKPAAAEKNVNASNGTKIAQKEKPFGTQIYNYLSREVMPTVGVGLVGLVVTAGLASYFLYPFGGLRRAYDGAVDRKDYHYDEFAAGGMAEEELIGKVIAGMPEQTVYPYRTALARKEANRNELTYNYRNNDPYYSHHPKRDFQTVSVGSKLGYGRDVVVEHQKESGYTVDGGEMKKPQFVVGNVPKEFEPVTPAAVPEHGPRSLRVRRRAQNVEDNEVINYESKTPHINQVKVQTDSTLVKVHATDSSAEHTAETSTDAPETPEARPTFFSFVRNLLEMKVRLGLDFLLNTTDKFSGYLRGVQQRVNNVFREQKSRVR